MVPAFFLWCFAPNHKLNDGWNRENFSIFHEGRLRVHSACRPYGMYVAGRPLRMSFENKMFRLVFESCNDVDSTETAIYITNRQRLSIRFSDGSIQQRSNNTLIFRHTPSIARVTHWIFIEFA